MKKGSFFSLFWPAWVQSFTKSNIEKAFKVTGIHPLDRSKVLDRFVTKPAEGAAPPSTPPAELGGTTSRKLMSQFDRVVADKSSAEGLGLRRVVHYIGIENELLHDQNKGLTESLKIKMKQNKKSKALPLVKEDINYWRGASGGLLDRSLRHATESALQRPRHMSKSLKMQR